MNTHWRVAVLFLLVSVSIILGDSIEGELSVKVAMNLDVENRLVNGMTHHYSVETANGEKVAVEGSHHELKYPQPN